MAEFVSNAAEVLEQIDSLLIDEAASGTTREYSVRRALHAVAAAKHMAELANDSATAVLAHEKLHLLGTEVRQNYGCSLKPFRGEYWLNCGAYNGHIQYGQSAELYCDVVCSICLELAEYCIHVDGDVYDGVTCSYQHRIRDDWGNAVVTNPMNGRHHSALATGFTFNRLRELLGERWVPGSSVSCDFCLNECPKQIERGQSADAYITLSDALENGEHHGPDPAHDLVVNPRFSQLLVGTDRRGEVNALDTISFYSDRMPSNASTLVGAGQHLGLGLVLHRQSGITDEQVRSTMDALEAFGQAFALHPHHIHPDVDWPASEERTAKYVQLAAEFAAFDLGEMRFGQYSSLTWRSLYDFADPTLTAVVALRLAQRERRDSQFDSLLKELDHAPRISSPSDSAEFWVVCASLLLTIELPGEAERCLEAAFECRDPRWSACAVVVSRMALADADHLVKRAMSSGLVNFAPETRQVTSLWIAYMLKKRRDVHSHTFFTLAEQTARASDSWPAEERLFGAINAHSAHARFGNHAAVSTIPSEIESGQIEGAGSLALRLAERRRAEGDSYGALKLSAIAKRRASDGRNRCRATILRAALLVEFGRPHHALRLLNKDGSVPGSDLAVEWCIQHALALEAVDRSDLSHAVLQAMAVQLEPSDPGWSRLTMVRANFVSRDAELPDEIEENILLDLAEMGSAAYVPQAVNRLADLAERRGLLESAETARRYAMHVGSSGSAWAQDPNEDGPVSFTVVMDHEHLRSRSL